VDACHKKCVPPKYADGELNKGESVCIDRCVIKYLEVHQKVGQKLQGQAEAVAAANAAAGDGSSSSSSSSSSVS
jgi:mitochondrial import inner membrane translocase subunit TIM10